MNTWRCGKRGCAAACIGVGGELGLRAIGWFVEEVCYWPESMMQELPSSITCPRCGKVSHHPNDVSNAYCGQCHDYFEMYIVRCPEHRPNQAMCTGDGPGHAGSGKPCSLCAGEDAARDLQQTMAPF